MVIGFVGIANKLGAIHDVINNYSYFQCAKYGFTVCHFSGLYTQVVVYMQQYIIPMDPVGL